MAETAKLSVYRIDQCGYYRREITAPEFGDTASIVTDLASFLRNKQLRDTCTFGEETDESRVMCVRPAERDGRYLFALLHVTPGSHTQVGYINPMSATSDPGITEVPTPRNRVAGHATYFWILPDKRAFVTVRRKGYPTGLSAFRRYMKGFVKSWSKYVVKATAEDDALVLGYSENGEAPAQPGLYARFVDRLLQDPKVVDFLRTNWERIRMVKGSEQLSKEREVDVGLWARIMGWADEDEAAWRERMVQTVRLRYQLAYTPSPAQLEDLLASSEFAEGDGGFLMDDGRTIKLSKSGLEREIELGDRVGTGILWDLKSLLKALNDVESSLFREVDT